MSFEIGQTVRFIVHLVSEEYEIQDQQVWVVNMGHTVLCPFSMVIFGYSLFHAGKVRRMGCRGKTPGWGRSPHTPCISLV
ncbi:MAG TPA: hypothetical protein V6C65_25885 [Allocoleopsis sp.]